MSVGLKENYFDNNNKNNNNNKKENIKIVLTYATCILLEFMEILYPPMKVRLPDAFDTEE